MGGGSVAGYYVSDARGLMLVGTRRRATTFADIRSARNETGDIDPESVLFHEYTHHFTFQYFPATYPSWYSEGFAEFWGATRILPGDIVEVGAPADHRFSTFRALGWLHLRRLLSGAQLQRGSGRRTSSSSTPKAGCWSAICSRIPSASGRSRNISG